MPKIIRKYTVDELANENKSIIISSQDGVEIHIEPTEKGTSVRLLFGNEVIKRDYDYLIRPAI